MIPHRKILVGGVTALLTMVTGVSAFTCNVCLPAVKGSKASKDIAVAMRANITRTWPTVAEKDMGECASFEQTSQFMRECSLDDEFSACSKIYNDDWFALTCGRLTEDMSAGCFDMKGGYKWCNCVSPLCNSPATAHAPISALLTASLAAAFRQFSF